MDGWKLDKLPKGAPSATVSVRSEPAISADSKVMAELCSHFASPSSEKSVRCPQLIPNLSKETAFWSIWRVFLGLFMSFWYTCLLLLMRGFLGTHFSIVTVSWTKEQMCLSVLCLRCVPGTLDWLAEVEQRSNLNCGGRRVICLQIFFKCVTNCH